MIPQTFFLSFSYLIYSLLTVELTSIMFVFVFDISVYLLHLPETHVWLTFQSKDSKFRIIFSTDNSVTISPIGICVEGNSTKKLALGKEIFATYSWRYSTFINIPSGNGVCTRTGYLCLVKGNLISDENYLTLSNAHEVKCQALKSQS